MCPAQLSGVGSTLCSHFLLGKPADQSLLPVELINDRHPIGTLSLSHTLCTLVEPVACRTVLPIEALPSLGLLATSSGLPTDWPFLSLHSLLAFCLPPPR